MPGLPQDFYKKVGANTVTTLAAPGKNLAATSINVGATTNYPTDTGIVVGIRVVDSNGTIVPGTYTEWNAVVASSTAITIEAVPVYGTDQVYPAGSLTQVFLMVSSSLHNQMVDGLLVSHDQDGKLKAGAISNSNMLANNTVTTPAITDASVTPDKINLGSATDKITTPESTTSGSYTNLATIGPTLNVTVPSNGRLSISYAASINSSNTGQAGKAAFTLSGANTRSAEDDEAIETQSIYATCSRTIALSGLTPGATTVKMVYLATGGTSTFRRRSLTVTPGL